MLAKDKVGEDVLMERALEAGDDDVRDEGEAWIVTGEPSSFSELASALAEYEPDSAGIESVV